MDGCLDKRPIIFIKDRAMSDYIGPNVDPTNPHATLRATSELMRSGDSTTVERLLGWALDFNPEHAGLLRRMSELRWDEAKVNEALDWAERALAAERGDSENYAHLGLLRMRQGRYAEAAELLACSIEIKPENPHYLRRLADIMAHLGRGEEAIDLARRAGNLRPKDASSYFFLAGLQQRYGDLDSAEDTILAGIHEMPESAPMLRRMAEFRLARGDIHGAQDWAGRVRTIAPNDPATYDFEATLALKNDDLAAAEDALRCATSFAEASSHHKRRLSDVLNRRGDRESAFIWAEKAIADHPQDLAGHIHIANLHLARGEHDAAYGVLEAAIGQVVKPKDATKMMLRLSGIAQQKGRREEAIDWAKRAIAANPFDAENHAQLSSLYLQQGDLTAAQEAAELAVHLAPGQGVHSRRISDIAWRRGETEAAFDWAARAIAVHPTDAQNHAHQATLLMRQGQNEAAEPLLALAVDLASADVGLLTRLSDLKMRLGKQDEALALAERTISSWPRDLVGYNHLATLYTRAGNLEAAEAVLTRAADIEPANTPILRRLADVAQRAGCGRRSTSIRMILTATTNLLLLN
jgi:tetratricopeptide (TPR) repeat protein